MRCAPQRLLLGPLAGVPPTHLQVFEALCYHMPSYVCVRLAAAPDAYLSARLRPCKPPPSLPSSALAPCSCSDVERAFAKWQANRQALVGLFPRLVHPGPPPQVGPLCLGNPGGSSRACWLVAPGGLPPPRLCGHNPPPVCPTHYPQYHGERVVFRRRQFNTVLTGAEFVSLSLLRLYWSERFTRGGARWRGWALQWLPSVAG